MITYDRVSYSLNDDNNNNNNNDLLQSIQQSEALHPQYLH